MVSTAPARATHWLAAATLLGAAVLVALRRTADPDFYWHIAIGREALSRRSLLPADLFSYSAQGAPWPYKDLLGAMVLYLSYRGLGFAGVALLKGASALGVGLALWLVPPRQRRRPVPWLAVCGMALAALQYRFTERPLLFSLACFPLLLGLCERVRRRADERGPRALLCLFLPPVLLCWCWSLLHREAMLGLAVLTALAVYLAAARLAPPALYPLLSARPSGAAVLSAALAACGAAALGLVNPFGINLYRTSLALVGDSHLQEIVREWRSYALPDIIRAFPVAASLCGGAALLLLVRIGRALPRREAGPVDLWHLGAWLALAWQLHGSVRWLPQLVAISAVACALVLAELPRPAPAPRGLAPLACAAVLALVHLTGPRPSGLGELPGQFPAGALAFAVEKDLGPRVVNASGFGGYIIWHAWPRFLVLIDGRLETVYSRDHIHACARAQREAAAFAAMRSRDGADWVLASNREGQVTHDFLAADPNWGLVYWSDAAVVYVRRDRYPRLAHLAYRWLRPGSLLESLEASLSAAHGDAARLAEIGGELLRIVETAPESVRAKLALALLLEHQGAREARDQVMTLLRQQHPEHPLVQEVSRRFRP